jgi:hypothetical protein
MQHPVHNETDGPQDTRQSRAQFDGLVEALSGGRAIRTRTPIIDLVIASASSMWRWSCVCVCVCVRACVCVCV